MMQLVVVLLNLMTMLMRMVGNLDRDDEVAWALTGNGKFTIRSVWDKIRRRCPTVVWGGSFLNRVGISKVETAPDWVGSGRV